MLAALSIGFQEHLLETGIHGGVPAPDGRKTQIETFHPERSGNVLDFAEIVGRKFQLVLFHQETLNGCEILLKPGFVGLCRPDGLENLLE